MQVRWYQNKFVWLVGGIVGAGIAAIASLSSSPTPTASTSTPAVLSAEFTKAFSVGAANAKVTVVQYSDFLCPGCSQVSLGVMPKIIEQYVKPGKVRFEFRPMAFVAQDSTPAGEGALCATDQGKFWQYHDAAYTAVWQGYFSKGIDPSLVTLYRDGGMKAVAQAAGVDNAQFDTCMTNHAHLADIQSMTLAAQNSGVRGTPYVVVNGQPINGVPTFDMLDAAIKAAL